MSVESASLDSGLVSSGSNGIFLRGGTRGQANMSDDASGRLDPRITDNYRP
jgi:hypothetical protein